MRDRTAVSPAVAPTAGMQTQSSAYFPAFDWMRGILALAVMLSHDGFFPVEYGGTFAVDVFFALSGWLVGGILLDTSWSGLPQFYFNRAVRIWCPYYLTLTLLIVASLLHDTITPTWWEFIAYKFTFVFNLFGIAQPAGLMPLAGTGRLLWSVNTEEQFYLLSPLLLVLAPPGFGRSMVTWTIVAAVAWWYGCYASIALGVLAAISVRRFGEWHRRQGLPWLFAGLAITAITAVLNGYRYESVAPLAAIGVVLALAYRGPVNNLGKIVGGMSYPLYLNHWVGMFVANALVRSPEMRLSLVHLAVETATNLGLALALYLYFDRPLLTRRKAWYTQSRGLIAAAVGYLLVAAGIAYGLYTR